MATTLYHAAEALRLLSVLLHPVLPERTAELWRRLGWAPPERLGEGLAWGELRPGTAVVAGSPLFPSEVGQNAPSFFRAHAPVWAQTLRTTRRLPLLPLSCRVITLAVQKSR